MMKMNRMYFLILLSVCLLIATGVGLIANLNGLFFTPISDEFHILKGSVSLTQTISNLAFSFGGIMSPKIIKESNFRKVLVLGTIIEVGCTLILTVCTNIYLMYILHGMRGFMAGVMGFVFVTIVINHWYQANVGLITSIALGFSGLAGAVFSPVISSVIQNHGWRTGYIVIAVMMAVLNLPAMFFLPSIKPETKGLKPYGESAETSNSTGSAIRSYEITSGRMILMYVYAMFACICTALVSHFPGYTQNLGLAASVGATMLSISLLANTGGKIILGILVDKIGAKKSLILFSLLILTALLIFLYIPMVMTLYVGALLIGLSYSLATVGIVTMSKDLFGVDNFGKTYPKISFAGTMANALFITVIGYLYDYFGNYTITLYILLGMIIVVLLIVFRVYGIIEKRKTV
ncbi:MAG: MFS transporter [Solobacterium sp.]|nr:MFS transporter [Solobacterium sp.]